MTKQTNTRTKTAGEIDEFPVVPIPAGFNPEERKKWHIKAMVNRRMEEADFVEVDCPFFGLRIGLGPEGFIRKIFLERNGGVVILFCSEMNGRPVVGLDCTYRMNLGKVKSDKERSVCMTGAVIPEGGNCCSILSEKVCKGVLKKARDILNGGYYTINRLYQEGLRKEQRTRFLKKHIPSDWLEPALGENEEPNTFKFKAGRDIGSKTGAIRFFFIDEAVEKADDSLVGAALALLMIEMYRENGKIEI